MLFRLLSTFTNRCHDVKIEVFETNGCLTVTFYWNILVSLSMCMVLLWHRSAFVQKKNPPGHINLSETSPLLHLRMNMQDPSSSISPLFPMLMLLTGLDMAFWLIEEMLAIAKFGWGDNNGVDGVVSEFWHWTLSWYSHTSAFIYLLLKYRVDMHFRQNGCPCAHWK